MVVKKHRLVRSASGKLIDDPRENDEGWPIYVIDTRKSTNWQLPESIERAIIIDRAKQRIVFFEESQKTEPVPIGADEATLEILFQQACSSDDEIIKTSHNRYFLMRFTKQVAKQAEKPHCFTPEYVFAQAFSAHYDEFAQHFPEFGRLKALSRLTILINYLSGIRHNLVKIITENQKKCEDPEHTFWQKTRSDHLVQVFTLNFRHILSGEIRSLSLVYRLDHLTVSASSKVVIKECERIFKKEKAAYTSKHGFFSRFDNSVPTLTSILARDSEQVAERLRQQYKDRLKKQMSDHFESRLSSHWDASTRHACIVSFLEGNELPLAFAIAVTANKYRRELDGFFKELGVGLTDKDCLQLLLSNQETLCNVVHRLNQSSSILLTDWVAQENKIKDQLRQQAQHYKQLKRGLEELGLGASDQEVNLEGVCTWVPAAVHQGMGRMVYGGVSLLPRVTEFRGTDPQAQRIERRVMSDPRVVEYGGVQLSQMRKSLASSIPPTERRGETYSTLAQRYRFFQARSPSEPAHPQRRREAGHGSSQPFSFFDDLDFLLSGNNSNTPRNPQRGDTSSEPGGRRRTRAAAGGGGRRPPEGGGKPPGGGDGPRGPSPEEKMRQALRNSDAFKKINEMAASNPNAKEALSKKLSNLKDAQKNADKIIEEFGTGKIRYYDRFRPSKTSGPTSGSRYVVEYDSTTGDVTAWNECYDQKGYVNRIRIKSINGFYINSSHFPPTLQDLLNKDFVPTFSM